MHKIALKEPYKEFIYYYKREQTRDTYAANLAYLCKLLEKELYEATDIELENVFKALRDKGLSGGYIQNLKMVMNSFFKYEKDHKHRKDDPGVLVMALDTGEAGGPSPKALTEKQREKVLSVLKWEDTLKEKKMGLAILFGLWECFRRFEIAKVQWDDINWEKNLVKVVGKARDSDHPDFVPLSKTLKQRLIDYKACVDKAGIDSRFILFDPDNPNKPVTRFVVGNWFKIIGKRCGFDKSVRFSSHIGRHTGCTMLNENDIPPARAIKISRHKDVNLYLSRYVKIEEEQTQKDFNQAMP